MGDEEFEVEADGPARCPSDCPNANAPYCPSHEDPSIYRRDDNKLHLVEAYAHNAAREMIFTAIEHLRTRRRLKEIRVPNRVMDEWLVFTKKVVLDSGEFTAQGEIERRVAAYIDKSREQDWAQLDRIKERYMRFTADYRGEAPEPAGPAAKDVPAAPDRKAKTTAARRPAKRKTASYEPEAEFYDDEM